MPRNLWRAVLAGGALLLAGAYGIKSLRSAERPAVPAGSRAEQEPSQTGSARIAELERQVRALQLTSVALAQNRGESGEHAGAERSADAERSTDTEARPLTDEEERARELSKRERDTAARQELLQSFSERVDTEPLDPEWRQATEANINRLFPERLGAGVELEEVKCASTVCRVALRHPGRDTLPSATWTRFVLDRGELESMAMQIDHKKDGTTTVYLLRESEEKDRK